MYVETFKGMNTERVVTDEKRKFDGSFGSNKKKNFPSRAPVKTNLEETNGVRSVKRNTLENVLAI